MPRIYALEVSNSSCAGMYVGMYSMFNVSIASKCKHVLRQCNLWGTSPFMSRE